MYVKPLCNRGKCRASLIEGWTLYSRAVLPSCDKCFDNRKLLLSYFKIGFLQTGSFCSENGTNLKYRNKEVEFLRHFFITEEEQCSVFGRTFSKNVTFFIYYLQKCIPFSEQRCPVMGHCQRMDWALVFCFRENNRLHDFRYRLEPSEVKRSQVESNRVAWSHLIQWSLESVVSSLVSVHAYIWLRVRVSSLSLLCLRDRPVGKLKERQTLEEDDIQIGRDQKW